MDAEESMQSTKAKEEHAIATYGCSKCSRTYLVAGEIVADPILCGCGNSLTPRALTRGVYALASSVADDVRATSPGRDAPGRDAPERDLGYGASHGYAPGHEGPSGPGDTPA
jgi:hypothetical protein